MVNFFILVYGLRCICIVAYVSMVNFVLFILVYGLRCICIVAFVFTVNSVFIL